MDNKYDIQTISVKPNDVILLQVSDYLDLDTIEQIYQEVMKAFPENNVLLANHHILEKLSIIRKDEGNPFENSDEGYEIELFK